MADQINNASLTDISSTAKNLVIAINGLTQQYVLIEGNRASQNLVAGTVVSSGQGRVVRMSVNVAGAPGAIYDSSSSTPAASSQIAYIPDQEGVYEIGIPVLYGIYVEPGAGQEVVVVYS